MSHYLDAKQLPDKDGPYFYTDTFRGEVKKTGPCTCGCPGHATKEEAYEHYRQWLLSSVQFRSAARLEKGTCCDVCNEALAAKVALIRAPHGRVYRWNLCATHAHRGVVERLLKSVTRSDAA